jgi:hypothetical protein
LEEAFVTDQAPSKSTWCECGYEPPCASNCPAFTPAERPSDIAAALKEQLAAERAAHARTQRWLDDFQSEVARKTIETMRLNKSIQLLRLAIAATLPHLPDDVRAGIDNLLEWLDSAPKRRLASAASEQSPR